MSMCKKRFIAIWLTALSLLSVGCSEEGRMGGSSVDVPLSHTKFRVGVLDGEGKKSSRAAENTAVALPDTVMIEMDGVSYALTCTVSDMDDPILPLPSDSTAATRGAMATTGNIASQYASFTLDGCLKSSDDPYFTGISFVPDPAYPDADPSVWYTTDALAEERFWPRSYSNDELTIYAWAPASGNFTISDKTYIKESGKYKGKTSFTYTGTGTTAASQSDLLFTTYGPETSGKDGTAQQSVNIGFHHALTCVRFRVADIASGTVVNKVELMNLYPNGTATYDPSKTTTGTRFEWTPGGTKTTFSQVLDYTVLSHNSDELIGSESAGTASFFIVPQQLGTDAQMRITFNGTQTRTTAIPVYKWEEGKKYEYKLSIPPRSPLSGTSLGPGVPGPSAGSAAMRLPSREEQHIATIPVDLAGIPCALTCTVADMPDPFVPTAADAAPATRGVMVGNGNIATPTGATIYVDGRLQSKDDADYFTNIPFTPFTPDPSNPLYADASRTYWHTTEPLAEERFWPRYNDELTIYTWYAHSSTSQVSSLVSNRTYGKVNGHYDGSASFTYTGPTPTDGAAAQSQCDLLFTSYGPATAGDDGTAQQLVKVNFHHALTCVRFRVGNLMQGLEVNSVTLKNLLPNGSCAYDPEGTTSYFTWTPSGTRTSYKQSYDFLADHDYVSATTNPLFGNDTDKSAAFFLVPQATNTTGNEVELEISFDYNGHTYTRSVSLAAYKSWKVGKVYTIELSLPNVKMAINADNTVENIGTSKAYVRATIVGNWYKDDASGNPVIVAPWSDSDGTFSGLPGSSWTAKKADGYYYYPNALDAGSTTTTPLFVSYTAPTPPVTGAYLKLDIAVQSVQYDASKQYATDAWGTTPAGYLN